MIKAEAHSDDFMVRVDFDATIFFRKASPEEIIKLDRSGWGDDYEADEVARFCACHSETELNRVFDYLELSNQPGIRGTMGFECHVDEASARQWLAEHRPDVLKLLPVEE